MVINSYLEKLSDHLLVSQEEKEYIKVSMEILKEKVNKLNGIKEHFCFGSYMRNTNLPVIIDNKADIDYIIVFNKRENEHPNDLFKKLLTFIKDNFSRQEIVRTYPTSIVLINGFKFELIPAYKEESYFINYKIPTNENNETQWVATVPNDFNEFLSKVDSDHEFMIYPLIRILKYWNVLNHHIFSSYHLENKLVFMDYPEFETLKEYLYYAIEHLPTDTLDEDSISKVKKLKETIEKIKNEENEELALHLLAQVLPFL